MLADGIYIVGILFLGIISMMLLFSPWILTGVFIKEFCISIYKNFKYGKSIVALEELEKITNYCCKYLKVKHEGFKRLLLVFNGFYILFSACSLMIAGLAILEQTDHILEIGLIMLLVYISIPFLYMFILTLFILIAKSIKLFLWVRVGFNKSENNVVEEVEVKEEDLPF